MVSSLRFTDESLRIAGLEILSPWRLNIDHRRIRVVRGAKPAVETSAWELVIIFADDGVVALVAG